MAEKRKIELKRVNMNLPANLVNRIEDYAYDKGYNVTSAYIALLNDALDKSDSLKAMPLIEQFKDAIQLMTNEDVDNVNNVGNSLSSK